MRINSKRFTATLILSSFLVIGLSGCGNLVDTSESTTSNENTATQRVGTNGELISIQSSNVSAAGYDVASLVMTVMFKNGAVYEYYGVQPEVWNEFFAAQPHPWSQVGYSKLVQSGLPYKRIK